MVAEHAGDDSLLRRAKAWVQSEEEQVHVLADLVEHLEAAERAGELDEAARLRDELTDLLYDLEGTADVEVKSDDEAGVGEWDDEDDDEDADDDEDENDEDEQEDEE